jgi:CheY-like chemotaxis protein
VSLNREILSALLDGTGASLDCAEDGQEAVKLFCQNPYDMVLMDLHMPGMDGFEAAQRIRESGVGACANIPIIAVTADTSDEVISRCTATGMNGHVSKPVDYDTLVDTLSQCYKPSPAAPVSYWEKWTPPRGI